MRFLVIITFVLAVAAPACSAEELLSVSLTSIKQRFFNPVDELFYGDDPVPRGCYVAATINNGTANHIEEVLINVDVGQQDPMTIKLNNLRAYQKYNLSVRANTTCLKLVSYISTSPLGYSVERCAMEGLREGDCLQMVRVVSQIPSDEAVKLDALCRPLNQQLVRLSECRKPCETPDWKFQECFARCKAKILLPPADPQCSKPEVQ
jgi:hypothetical protein